ncbi:hypothetical protein GQ55_3G312000 [Panicum hallii var. hallii]|uniref:Uncharacterized protein n=1 Tax=Panicum hallii var. hallii TaxID=1504633 RepID=A0A2T7EF68_9POAL|nr:hypothetical protein GQ55_3G312000 [Panicum hallii var. hallii]
MFPHLPSHCCHRLCTWRGLLNCALRMCLLNTVVYSPASCCFLVCGLVVFYAKWGSRCHRRNLCPASAGAYNGRAQGRSSPYCFFVEVIQPFLFALGGNLI